MNYPTFMTIETTETTRVSVLNKFDNEELHITIWPDDGSERLTGHELPQIEIWTRRGESASFNGAEAIAFAEWLRDKLVNPILSARQS